MSKAFTFIINLNITTFQSVCRSSMRGSDKWLSKVNTLAGSNFRWKNSMSLKRLWLVLNKDLRLKRLRAGSRKRWVYFQRQCHIPEMETGIFHVTVSFLFPPYPFPSLLLPLLSPPFLSFTLHIPPPSPRYVNAFALNSLWMNVRGFLKVPGWKKLSTRLERPMSLSGNEWVDNLWHQWPVQWTLP